MMSSSNRPAKFGSEWTFDDLVAYNVNIIDTDITSFFGRSQLPYPSVSPELLTISNFSANKDYLDKDDRLFFELMQTAMKSSPEEEQFTVLNFIIHLLHMLGFKQPGGRIVRKQQDLPLFMCGRTVHVILDTCIYTPEDQEVLLIVKEDKRLRRFGCDRDPEPQLFAEAVAAFQSHNRALRITRLPPLENRVIPAIIMSGTVPVFYKFNISAGLVESIQTGQCPPRATIVHRFVPPVDRPLEMRDEGMVPVDNRGIVLSCLEAFKACI